MSSIVLFKDLLIADNIGVVDDLCLVMKKLHVHPTGAMAVAYCGNAIVSDDLPNVLNEVFRSVWLIEKNDFSKDILDQFKKSDIAKRRGDFTMIIMTKKAQYILDTSGLRRSAAARCHGTHGLAGLIYIDWAMYQAEECPKAKALLRSKDRLMENMYTKVYHAVSALYRFDMIKRGSLRNMPKNLEV